MRFLSRCIGLPVRDPSGEPLGSIADLIVAIGGKYPPVTGLVVKTDGRRIFIPWVNVDQFEDDGARLLVRTIDIGGRKVIRVNDVSLDNVDGRLRVVAVDVGAA